MPSGLALAFTLALIVYLFVHDVRREPRSSPTLWIPLIWMLLSGSRFVSEWLSLGAPYSAQALAEGSPVDRAVFLTLIFAGVLVLIRRRVSIVATVRHNPWLTLYLCFCFLSISWSEAPYVAFKRWIKTIGEPVMVMLLATEADPVEAVRRLIRRCSYILIPLSVMLVRYFPEMGRSYSAWTGQVQFVGVTQSKNALGLLCLVVGVFLVCDVFHNLKSVRGPLRRQELLITIALLAMTWWLLTVAKSATSMMSFVIGACVAVALSLPFVKHRNIGAYMLVTAVVLFIADATLGVISPIINMLGKDTTLTGRTEMWPELLKMAVNPMIGAGFESFWYGDRLTKLWGMYWWRPQQAHNGYLEVYLNLGLIGLVIVLLLIVGTYRRSRLTLLRDFESGRFRMSLLASLVIYNWTEAGFRPLGFAVFALYIIAIEYPQAVPQKASVRPEGTPATHLHRRRYRGRTHRLDRRPATARFAFRRGRTA